MTVRGLTFYFIFFSFLFIGFSQDIQAQPILTEDETVEEEQPLETGQQKETGMIVETQEESYTQNNAAKFQFGILAALNYHNTSTMNVGFTGWVGHFGAELTFGYRGKDDNSRLDKKPTNQTPAATFLSGTTTTNIYFADAGSTNYDEVTGAQFSIQLMPKIKLAQMQNSYFFIGIPLHLIPSYSNHKIVTENSDTWNTNGTTSSASDTADDYVSNRRQLIYEGEETHKLRFDYGLVLGGALKIPSIENIELSFGVGFLWGTGDQSTVSQKATYDNQTLNSGGTVTSNTFDQDYLNSVPSNFLVTGDKNQNSSQGKNNSFLGVMFQLKVAYYFL